MATGGAFIIKHSKSEAEALSKNCPSTAQQLTLFTTTWEHIMPDQETVQTVRIT